MKDFNWFENKIKELHNIINNLQEEIYVYIKKKEVIKKERSLDDYIEIDDKITNFQYIEFVRSNTAKRYNISNIPGENHWQNIEYLVEKILQPLRDKFGRIRITSGYRSEELNTLVKGSLSSFHCHGMAADIIPLKDKITNLNIIEYIYNNFDFTELIYEYPPNGWVHVGISKGREKERKLKLKDANHDYEIVTLSYILSGEYKKKG